MRACANLDSLGLSISSSGVISGTPRTGGYPGYEMPSGTYMICTRLKDGNYPEYNNGNYGGAAKSFVLVVH